MAYRRFAKKEVPLRSVVSSIGSSPLIGKTEHNVKNSMDFVKGVNGLEVTIWTNR